MLISPVMQQAPEMRSLINGERLGVWPWFCGQSITCA